MQHYNCKSKVQTLIVNIDQHKKIALSALRILLLQPMEQFG